MAVSLPESFAFGLLSRLPPQSFEFQWVQMEPDIFPNNGYYDMKQVNRPNIHIRGAPNEFALNTNMFLGGTLHSHFKVNNLVSTTAGDSNGRILDTQVPDALKNLPFYKYGPSWFKSSRESFNSGALPFLDNQDNTRHIQINQYRGRCARRNVGPEGQKIDDLEQANYINQGSFPHVNVFNPGTSAGSDAVSHVLSNPVTTMSVTAANIAGVATSDTPVVIGSNLLKWKVPLGMYSSLINCHSVIPIGLMSAYSVNGYSIQWETEFANSPVDLNTPGMFQVPAIAGIGGAIDTNTAKVFRPQLVFSRLSGLKIYVPIVKVLDPAVMESVLALYEKREPVNIGGVTFPMSLRLNTLGFRQFSFPLNNNAQSEYYFRLPMSDKSVRGYMFFLANRGGTVDFNTGVPVGSQLALTRLETRIGSLRPHPCIDNRDPGQDNINQFLYDNLKKSAYCWSPFPYYLENQREDMSPEDFLLPYRSGLLSNAATWADDGTSPVVTTATTNSLLYGCVSFENMDHREPDYATSYQASGYDLTNRGGIDIYMRFNTASSNPTTGEPSYGAPVIPNEGLNIVFVTAYDSIMEISPAGVIDVTSSVL